MRQKDCLCRWGSVLMVMLIGPVGLSFGGGSPSGGGGGGGGSISITDPVDSYAEELKGWAAIIESSGDYLRAIGEERLDEAKADFTEAQAAQEWQKARKLKLLVDRMQLELQRLRQTEYKDNEEISRINEYADTLKLLTQGKTSVYVFQAWNYLTIHAVPTSVLISAMTAPIEAAPEADFIPNDPNAEVAAFSGTNVGQLMEFLQKGDLSLEPWTAPHIAVLKAMDQMGQAASAKLAEIQANMDALRKGTLDVWNAPDAPKETNPNTPDPSGPQTGTQPTGLFTAESCLPAKADFAQCLADGYGEAACLPADEGYQQCRNEGYSHDQCLAAKSSYSLCRADGNSRPDCLAADDGYEDCIHDGYASKRCIGALPGYGDCRKDGHPFAFCFKASSGYGECRKDGNPPALCLTADAGFAACRQDGLSPSLCASALGGYAGCRATGQPPEFCLKADNGFEACATHAA